MECPNCGASGKGAITTTASRTSHEVAVTRVKKCTACSANFYSVELPVDRDYIFCRKHYHIKKGMLLRLLSALYS